MGLSADALITLNDFWTFMGWGTGSQGNATAQVETVIESVSAAFNSTVGCAIKETEYLDELLDGWGRTYLYLPAWPVTDLAFVYEDSVLLTETDDYTFDAADGTLWRAGGGKWPKAKQIVSVDLTAGYATVPADIKLACLIEVARKFNVIKDKMFGESSRTQEGVSIDINTDELLPETLSVLRRYRRTRI